MHFAVIAGGAAIGAVLRYLVVTHTAAWLGGAFPYGTLIVNATGAFALGLIAEWIGAHASVDPHVRLFFVTGVLGGYTTFSSYAWEALELTQSGLWLRALLYAAASNVAGFIGVALGALIARSASL
ncbi:MAG: fluoride efflux transporter CrcB [Chloroflexota bacterium]|nr:fluoride efflux transporter CrcB [Dehalococcoidia bacterium]MDW8254899.1 fluoride efflux transporter CrcB [Chloroflexota bacterium]